MITRFVATKLYARALALLNIKKTKKPFFGRRIKLNEKHRVVDDQQRPMTAILHCIITDIEDSRVREQLRVWREKTDTDPLIREIRELRKTSDDLAKKIHNCETLIEAMSKSGWGMAFAGFNLRNSEADDIDDNLQLTWDEAMEDWNSFEGQSDIE